MNFIGYKQRGGVIQIIMDGILNDIPEVLEQISKLDEKQQQALMQQITMLAQKGDQKAIQVVKKLSNPQIAKLGSKLSYIKRLKGCCPEGTEVSFDKKGNKICKCGSKIKKKK